MGAWGTAISSNDTFADIYDEFFDLYNDGVEVEEISKRLIANNKEIINDPDDSNNFWFALAKAQWECKQLNKDIYANVENIIDTGADIEVWKNLGADAKDLKKRKIVLDKFLSDLSFEKSKVKSRKRKKETKIIPPVFKKGDCITFKLANGNYGGALVLEALYNSEYPYNNLIAATRINQFDKPSEKDFKNSEVLIQNFEMWKDSPNILWYSPVRHKNIVSLIEVIGKIKIEKPFSYYVSSSTEYGSCGDFNIWIVEQTNKQFEYEQNNSKSQKRVTIEELAGINKWKLW